MKTILRLLIGALACLACAIHAAEPTNELDPGTALRLVALKTGVNPSAIEIPFIIEGSSRCPAGFEARHVRRVATILPVREGSNQRRRLVFHEIHWNESLGWFMWESRAERAGEAVYLWSERKGHIVNR
jgi:hypothetical protein